MASEIIVKDSGARFSLHFLRGISSVHRNNEALTSAELQSRSDDILDAQEEIYRLDLEITRLQEALKVRDLESWCIQETLEVLEMRRVELRMFKDQEISLFAPIRILPDDVLKKIFLTCQYFLEKRPDFIHYYNPTTFVRTATQVSNYWRNTALSMPDLWSRISFKPFYKFTLPTFGYGDDSDSDDPMEVLKSPGEFLERCLTLSGIAPIFIEFSNECSPEKLDEKCLKKLAEAADRWRHLFRDDGEAVSLDTVLKYVPNETAFPSLKGLGPVESLNPITLHSTPILFYITVNARSRLQTFLFIRHPSLNIFKSTAEDEALAMFYTSPEHQSIISNAMQPSNLNVELSASITLPKLEYLTFQLLMSRDSDNVVSTGPLKFFNTPNLKQLNIVGRCDADSKLILDLILRSGCNLEKLTLHGNILLRGNWVIDPLKNLKYLYVRWPTGKSDGDFSKVLKFLTFKKSGKNPKRVFPRLESLDIYTRNFFMDGDPFSMKDFKTIALSRLPPKTMDGTGSPGIKSMKLIFRLDLDEEFEKRLNKFCETLRQSNVDVVVDIELGGAPPLVMWTS